MKSIKTVKNKINKLKISKPSKDLEYRQLSKAIDQLVADGIVVREKCKYTGQFKYSLKSNK